MRSFLQGTLVAAIFLAANVVGAGVMQVLGQAWLKAVPNSESIWPWFVIGLAGVGAAWFFLAGVFWYARRRPLLQWWRGRRGG